MSTSMDVKSRQCWGKGGVSVQNAGEFWSSKSDCMIQRGGSARRVVVMPAPELGGGAGSGSRLADGCRSRGTQIVGSKTPVKRWECC